MSAGSCNLLVQCEPDYFDDKEIRGKQRKVAIAMIHGENDPVVKFSGGEWCYRAMVDGNFPKLHFFTDKRAAHMFAHLPVDKAVRWLDTMTSTDSKTVLAFAEKQFRDGNYRDATGALVSIQELGVPSGLDPRVSALQAKINAKARPEADRLAKAIRAGGSHPRSREGLRGSGRCRAAPS